MKYFKTISRISTPILFCVILLNELFHPLKHFNTFQHKHSISSLNLNSKSSAQYHETIKVVHQTTQPSTSRPQLEDSIISPSGRFILHFDTTGFNAVPSTDLTNDGIPDYIDSAGVIFDYVWMKEINEMGFHPPLNEDGDPVDNYHVYFLDLSNLYGRTVSDSQIRIRSNFYRYTSYSLMDNNYEDIGFKIRGLDALKVTAAHEFNHAIQLSYGVHWENKIPLDIYFMEMTSTWIEDIVYDSINRYVEYLPFLFENFSNTSITSSYYLYPYANSLFLKMLEQQYGWNIVLDIWEKVKEMKSTDAMREIFSLYNTSLLFQLHQYGVWLHFTEDHPNADSYFPEGHLYPRLQYQFKDTHRLVDELALQNQVAPLSSQLVQLTVPRGGDFYSILKSQSSDVLLSHITESTVTDNIPVNQKSYFSINPENQMRAIITNASVDTLAVEYAVTQAITHAQQPVLAFPNPVKYPQDKEVIFMNLQDDSRITLYSSDGYRIAQLSNRSYSSRTAWDLKKENGQVVSTGVYIYVISDKAFVTKGKIAIIR